MIFIVLAVYFSLIILHIMNTGSLCVFQLFLMDEEKAGFI